MIDPPLESPNAEKANLSQGECRASLRHLCPYLPMVRLLVRPSFTCLRAFVHDASTQGICFLLDFPLERGSVVAFELRHEARGQTRILSARVVHTEPGEEGLWRVGCELATPLTKEELEFLLERA